jgi:hypothetical protein
MKNTIVHNEGAASLEVAVQRIKLSGSMIKMGLDVHARLYVAVAQYDHLLPPAGAADEAHGVCAVGRTTLARGPHRACGLRGVRFWL